jgi:Tol biopolymer transport system component
MARSLAAAAVLVVFLGGASSTASTHARGVILFWSDKAGGPSLWSIKPDGSHRRWIFRTHRGCKRPSLSPDRKWILFDGPRPGHQEPVLQFDVQIVRRDGTGRRTLTSSDDREIEAQWSPDGSRISYARLRQEDGEDWRKMWIWTMRPDGSDQRPLVPGNSPHWSPDGKQLVFTAPVAGSDGDLFVINADGSGLRHLLVTRKPEWPDDWSPDGKKILFTRSFNETSSDLFVMNVDRTGVRRLTRTRGIDSHGTWSPDGSRIVFESDRYRWSHLFVMRSNGTRRHELTNGQANDYAPNWQ